MGVQNPQQFYSQPQQQQQQQQQQQPPAPSKPQAGVTDPMAFMNSLNQAPASRPGRRKKRKPKYANATGIASYSTTPTPGAGNPPSMPGMPPMPGAAPMTFFT